MTSLVSNPPRIFENVTELVGHTPMVEIHSHGVTGVQIYAKLESFNPGG